jgi:hypothetical protein
MKKSVNVITKYIGTYIYFNISFVLWFVVPFIFFLTGFYFIFDSNQASTFGLQIFITFTIPIMAGIGFYFYPYYNIAKFKLCEALLAEMERSEDG